MEVVKPVVRMPLSASPLEASCIGRALLHQPYSLLHQERKGALRTPPTQSSADSIPSNTSKIRASL